MSSYVLVDIDIHDEARYSEYRPRVVALIGKHGGRLTHKIAGFETVEGTWSPKRIVIIEFPDRAHARAFLDDPEYVPVKQIRLESATSSLVVGSTE